MNAPQIANLRLANQQISVSDFTEPEKLVRWMGCIQAQDFAMAKWAIGSRLKKTTDLAIEKEFNENKILRTHVLRPTWHFVSPVDIHWMLKLSANRIKALMNTQLRQLSVDSAVLKKSKKIIEKALVKNGRLTRKELQVHLAKEKINTDDTRMSFLLMHSELDGIICSAGRLGKQFAYDLLDKVAPTQQTIAGDQALAELTKRFFLSHGPATAQDFARWSGLSLVLTQNGIFKPLIVVNGQVSGLWKPGVKQGKTVIEIDLFQASKHPVKELMQKAIRKYISFRESR